MIVSVILRAAKASSRKGLEPLRNHLFGPDHAFESRPNIKEWRDMTGHRCLALFLNPELVHSPERRRTFCFENVPAFEVGGRSVFREPLPVGVDR